MSDEQALIAEIYMHMVSTGCTILVVNVKSSTYAPTLSSVPLWSARTNEMPPDAYNLLMDLIVQPVGKLLKTLNLLRPWALTFLSDPPSLTVASTVTTETPLVKTIKL